MPENQTDNDNHEDNDNYPEEKQGFVFKLISGVIDAFNRTPEGNWNYTAIVAVLAIFIATAGLIIVFRMPADERLKAFVICVVALIAILVFILIYKKLTIDSTDTQEPHLREPEFELEIEEDETVVTNYLPLNIDYIASETGRSIANDFNNKHSESPASRFFIEMLIHRLNFFDATPHGTGYTIVRHIEELPLTTPESQRIIQLREKVMRQDYAAIFDVAIASTPTNPGFAPQFDTVIFRDLELWLDPNYWEDNQKLSQKTNMRRLFLYEKEMFILDSKERTKLKHRKELCGLFIGLYLHRVKKWDYRVLNVSDLNVDSQQKLLGPDYEKPEIQSSAAFGNHTIVFIKLIDEGKTLVHRFYSDRHGDIVGKVRSFSNRFSNVFKGHKAISEETLRDILKNDYPQVAEEIEKVYQDAMEQVETG